jgi:hypothetical protein
MEEKSKPRDGRHSLLWEELQEKAKGDPELAKQLEVAMSIIERYSETLQMLADS